MKRVSDYITQLHRKEPAVLVGLLLTIVSAVAHSLADHPDIKTWQAAIPLIVSVIIRQFVYSPATVTGVAEQAHTDGQLVAFTQVASARSEAAKKAAVTKARKLSQTTVAVPAPKPRTKKRSTAD